MLNKQASDINNMTLNQEIVREEVITIDLFNSKLNRTQSQTKEQILLVDDTPSNLQLISEFLLNSGFNILVAKNGVQALKILERTVPDLILLDVVMPEMDGFETCRRLKEWKKTKDIPVIFMTAVAGVNPADKIKGLTIGAVDYISKPVQLEEVLARVKIHLHLRSLTQQLQQQNIQLHQEIQYRKQAEAEIIRTNDLLQSIFNESTDALFLVNIATGLIMDCNQRAVDLFAANSKDELINIEGQTLQKEPFTQEQLADIKAEIESKGFWSHELEYVTKKSTLFWGNIAVKQIQVAGKKMNLVRVTDITERKQAEARERQYTEELKRTLDELKRTQTQLIQAEKMSSLGRMVAGVAHEINNPVSFIYSNLHPAQEYFQDLNSLLELYQETYPHPTSEINQLIEKIDLDFLREDWQNLLRSMHVGAERICEIVRSLKSFSRLDEAELKPIDIHQGIDDTLLILHNRIRAEGDRPQIQVIKNYAQLPCITCYASQLNQVFMNLICNAIDALDNQPEPRVINISTKFSSGAEQLTTNYTVKTQNKVIIEIADNGHGMNQEVLKQIFDPFFTTKPIGSGTGLGLAISHQIIVEKHGGQITCVSAPEQGTKMIVEIPVCPTASLCKNATVADF